MQVLFALLCGLLFGTGLLICGMSNPAKVLGFLDLAGRLRHFVDNLQTSPGTTEKHFRACHEAPRHSPENCPRA